MFCQFFTKDYNRPLISIHFIDLIILSVFEALSALGSLKYIGIVHLTFTGTPSCVPGLYLGIIDTIRSASLSKEGDMLFSILGCVTEPFSSI